MIKHVLAAVSSCLLASTALSAAPAVGLGGTVKATQPVLGSTKVFGRYGTGWGTVKPNRLDDDTDCSGTIYDIHWHSWGGPTARGMGTSCTEGGATGGGAKVRIRLRPTDLGECKGSTRVAYRQFKVEFPKPHGGWRPEQDWLGLKNYCKSEQSQV